MYINPFTTTAQKHYAICALWTEYEELTGDTLPPGEADADLLALPMDPDTQEEMNKDVADFIQANWDDVKDLDPEQVGHDFWLTRNGHGVGFRDRGLGELGDRLTDACESYGEFWLYMGDDGLVWGSS